MVGCYMAKNSPQSKGNITHIPDIHAEQWERAIEQYLTEVEPLNKEAARSLRFGILFQEALGLEPGFIEDYVAGVEQYLKVKHKDRILKGRADNLFGNVVIEFEAMFPEHRSGAEEQLRRYVAILWLQESPDRRIPYLCITTDGVRYVTYSPTLADRTTKDVLPEDVRLDVIEEADWQELKHYEVFSWLDRYFLRKEVFAPTSDRIVRDFRLNSHAFTTTANALIAVWEDVKAGSAANVPGRGHDGHSGQRHQRRKPTDAARHWATQVRAIAYPK